MMNVVRKRFSGIVMFLMLVSFVSAMIVPSDCEARGKKGAKKKKKKNRGGHGDIPFYFKNLPSTMA